MPEQRSKRAIIVLTIDDENISVDGTLALDGTAYYQLVTVDGNVTNIDAIPVTVQADMALTSFVYIPTTPTEGQILAWDATAGRFEIVPGVTFNTTTGLATLGGATVDTLQLSLTFVDGAEEGRIQWNAEDGVPEVGLPGGRVTMQIGQEMPFRFKNDQGTDVGNGRLVYISGGQGSRVLFKLADPGSDATAHTVGMATEDIGNGQFGYINTIGLVRGEDDQPLDTSAWTPNTKLYLGDNGTFTDVEPTAPSRKITIGTVIVQHQTQGIIFVRIEEHFNLSELSDVYLSGVPGEGSILAWDAIAERWEIVPGVSFDTTSGYLTLSGDATVWDDLRVPVSSIARLGFTDPGWVKVTDNGAGSVGVYALGFDDGPAEEEIYFTVQLPHTWKAGSTIYPHVHWGPALTGGGNVVWGLEYTWQNINSGAFAASTLITGTSAAGTTANAHLLTDIGAGIVGTGKGDSSMLLCRLFRNAGSASDTLTGDALLYEIDFHYEVDSLGEST